MSAYPDQQAARSLISVIGGGAVGGLLAALLARSGAPVELIVRECYQEAYRAGLQVTTAEDAFRQHLPVETTPSPNAALLVVAVKMPDLEATCRQIAEAWPDPMPSGAGATLPLPVVLLLQNGLDALDIAERYLPPERLYAAVVELGATALRPAAITYSIPGRLLLGSARPGPEALTAHVAAMLAPALRADLTDDIRGAQRLKLLINLNNGVGAATGLTVQQLYASRAGVRVSLGVMREGLATLDGAGLAPPANRRSRGLRAILGLPEAFGITALRLARLAMRQRAPVYASTLQSVLRRRPSEIRWLNGRIVQLGQQHGIATPLNRAVVDVVDALESGAISAKYVTPAALLAAGRSA